MILSRCFANPGKPAGRRHALIDLLVEGLDHTCPAANRRGGKRNVQLKEPMRPVGFTVRFASLGTAQERKLLLNVFKINNLEEPHSN